MLVTIKNANVKAKKVGKKNKPPFVACIQTGHIYTLMYIKKASLKFNVLLYYQDNTIILKYNLYNLGLFYRKIYQL